MTGLIATAIVLSGHGGLSLGPTTPASHCGSSLEMAPKSLRYTADKGPFRADLSARVELDVGRLVSEYQLCNDKTYQVILSREPRSRLVTMVLSLSF